MVSMKLSSLVKTFTGFAIVAAHWISPTNYALINYIACSVCTLLMLFPKLEVKVLLYIVSAVYGFNTSTIYGNGVNFAAKRLNFSGSLGMGIFYFASQLFPMFNPEITAVLMGK